MNQSTSKRTRITSAFAVMFDAADLLVLLLNLLPALVILFGAGDPSRPETITREQIYACLGLLSSTCLIILLKGIVTFFESLVGPKVHKAPGYRLLAFVRFFYSSNVVTRVFEPLVADWQMEYCEALSQGRTVKARWISIRYSWQSVLAMGLLRVFYFISRVRR
jgi:hypothetical protein